MADETNSRRIKKTGEATHRKGKLRAAVKASAPTQASLIATAINEFMQQIQAGSVSQTMWGTSLASHATTLRKNFALDENEDIYLLLDLDGNLAGGTGMLLSASGLRLKGGTGGNILIKWDNFKQCAVGMSQGVLIIDQSGIVTPDGQVLSSLLKYIQAKLNA